MHTHTQSHTMTRTRLHMDTPYPYTSCTATMVNFRKPQKAIDMIVKEKCPLIALTYTVHLTGKKNLHAWRFSVRPSDKIPEKGSSRLHEESFSPGWATRAEKSHVIARKNFKTGWQDDWPAWEDANCQNSKGYRQIPAWLHFRFVTARAEIFHVIGDFSRPGLPRWNFPM